MSHYFDYSIVAGNMQLLDSLLRDMFLPEDLLSSDRVVAINAWRRVMCASRKDQTILCAWNLIHEYNQLQESGKMDSWSEEDKAWSLRCHALYAAEYLNHLTTYSDDLMAVGAAKAIVDALAKEGVNVVAA